MHEVFVDSSLGLIEDYGEEKIVSAVIECGEDKWYQFGLALGLKDGKITSVTADKIVASAKLQKVIQAKTAIIGAKNMLKELLLVCRKLKIYGAVVDELKGKVRVRGLN